MPDSKNPNNKNDNEAIKKVTDLTEEVVKGLGFELVDIHFGQHGRQKIVEITIYNPGGSVGLTDCEKVSRELDSRIEVIADSLDFFHGPFLLDVSSPGIDRILKSEREYKLFTGRKVEIKTKTNVGADPYGQHFIARLVGFADETFKLSEIGPIQSAPTKSKNSKKHAANKVSHEPVKELKVAIKQIIQIRLYPDLQKKFKEIANEPAIDLTAEAGAEEVDEKPNKVEVERD